MMKNLLIIQRGNGNNYMVTATKNVKRKLSEVQDANHEEVKIIFDLGTSRWSYILDRIGQKYMYQHIHHDWFDFPEDMINEVISDINKLAIEKVDIDKELLDKTFIVFGKTVGNDTILLCNKEDSTFNKEFKIDLNGGKFTESNQVFLVSIDGENANLTLDYDMFLKCLEIGKIEVQ